VDGFANKDVNAVNEQVNGDISEASEPVNGTGPRWAIKLVKELKLEIEALERQLAERSGQINKITEAMIEERKRTDSVIMQQVQTIDDLSSQLQLTEAKNRTWWRFWW
jgi:RNA processing factor Prp31